MTGGVVFSVPDHRRQENPSGGACQAEAHPRRGGTGPTDAPSAAPVTRSGDTRASNIRLICPIHTRRTEGSRLMSQPIKKLNLNRETVKTLNVKAGIK